MRFRDWINVSWLVRRSVACAQQRKVTSARKRSISIFSVCLPVGVPSSSLLAAEFIFALSSPLSRLCLIIIFYQPPSSLVFFFPLLHYSLFHSDSQFFCLGALPPYPFLSPVYCIFYKWLQFILLIKYNRSLKCANFSRILQSFVIKPFWIEHYSVPLLQLRLLDTSFPPVQPGQKTEVCLEWSAGSRPGDALSIQLPSCERSDEIGSNLEGTVESRSTVIADIYCSLETCEWAAHWLMLQTDLDLLVFALRSLIDGPFSFQVPEHRWFTNQVYNGNCEQSLWNLFVFPSLQDK